MKSAFVLQHSPCNIQTHRDDDYAAGLVVPQPDEFASCFMRLDPISQAPEWPRGQLDQNRPENRPQIG